jgi:hypothetical protein
MKAMVLTALRNLKENHKPLELMENIESGGRLAINALRK